MSLFSKKNISTKTICVLSLLVTSTLFYSVVKADEDFNVEFRDLTKAEETRRKKIGEDKLLILNYKGITKKDFVIVDHTLSSMPFAKIVMCGNRALPTVFIKRVEKDKQEKYVERNFLMIYDDSLNEIAFHQESSVVSNQFTDSPDKFKVSVQPKFTLETVEAFVCNSQAPLCEADEEVSMQCTFEDGRQANVCIGKYDNRLKIGRPSNELELNHRLTVGDGNGYGYIFNKYRTVEDLQEKGLTGVGKSISFHNSKGTEYAFERHWSARSRDDYDFHAEFNIRKDGKIIESHGCIEGNFD